VGWQSESSVRTHQSIAQTVHHRHVPQCCEFSSQSATPKRGGTVLLGDTSKPSLAPQTAEPLAPIPPTLHPTLPRDAPETPRSTSYPR
jgi:hypothetical protein